MKSRPFSLRSIILFAFGLLSLPGNPCAFSAPRQNPPFSFSWNWLSSLSRMRPLDLSPGMPGETPAFADFDGDQKQDVAIALLSENRYTIVVLLSTRSQATILNPSVQLAGFMVHACDINNDSFQDVVVTDATAKHPLAVWFGDGHGNFKIADQNHLKNDFAFDESSKFQTNRLSPDPDLLNESPDPTCLKIAPAFGDPALEQKGFVPCWTNSCALRNVYTSIAPRSPPINNPTQTILLFSCHEIL